MYTKVSHPALKQIPTTVSVNSWLIVWSKMATALCKNAKRKTCGNMGSKINRKQKMEFKGTAKCKQILCAWALWTDSIFMPLLQPFLGSKFRLQVGVGPLIWFTVFISQSYLHEGQLLNSEQLGPGHLQMPSFWAFWWKHFLGAHAPRSPLSLGPIGPKIHALGVGHALPC